jgi:signal transduction histidine kinase
VKPYSISRRLVTTVLLVQFVAAVCVTGVALIYERHAHFHAFDVLLHGRADSMLGAVQDAEDANDNVMLDGTEVTVPSDDIYEVRDAGGRLLGRSSNWSGVPADDAVKIKTNSHNSDEGAFFLTSVNGNAYRVMRLHGSRVVDPGDKGGGIRRNVTIYYGSQVKRVWMAVLRAAGFYAASSLAVLACTGILMSWLLNRGLAPLRELASSASRVSATSWTFEPPQEARVTQELEPLVLALETLLLGLQGSFEQQKRFVGDAAHELKTSVAVVKSSLQLLGMKQRSTEEYHVGLERCLTDCERMETIVGQMLTLAQVGERSAAIAASFRTDPSASLQEVAGELKTMAESKGISIVLQGDQAIELQVDAEEFKLLCRNLLINALQHSPSNSAITVSLYQDGSQAEVNFRDEGEGIFPEDIPRVFERFARSDPSRSRKTGGTGLGLAICKAIVEKSGGIIEIHSRVNSGTTVRVRLPIADALQPSL